MTFVINNFQSFYKKNRKFLYRKLKAYYYYKAGIPEAEIGRILNVDRRRVHQLVQWGKEHSDVLDKYSIKDIKTGKDFKLYRICKELYSDKIKVKGRKK